MLDAMIGAALAGGHEILAVHANLGNCEARDKGDGSPVTIADERAEAAIFAALEAFAPDIPIVAEEAAAAGIIPRTARRFFLVDPLDGTKEFVAGSEDFTVNIALIEDGEPVVGVVYAPASGAIFAGDPNGAREALVADGRPGTWKRLQVAAMGEGGGISVIASKSHMSPATKDYCDRFPVDTFISAGSSLKFCRVARGDAHLYPRMGRTMEWDTAAGDAVLRAAGGRVCTLDGQLLRYGKRAQPDDCDFANPWFVAHGEMDPFAHQARD